MSTVEKIKYEIDAEDKATAKIRKASAAVQASAKNVKEFGGQAKKSSEFASVLSRTLGDSAFGGFAAQIGDIADKTAQFNEVATQGKAAAIAFKLAIIGITAVVTYKIAETIQAWWMETDKWSKSLAKAREEAGHLNDTIAQNNFARFNRDIDQLKDGLGFEDQQKAISKWSSQFQVEIEGVKGQLEAAEGLLANVPSELEKRLHRFNIMDRLDGIDLPNSDVNIEEQQKKVEQLQKQVRDMQEFRDKQLTSVTWVDIEREKAAKLAEEEEVRAAKRKALAQAAFDFAMSIEDQMAKANEKKIADQNKLVESQLASVEALKKQAFEAANGKEAALRAQFESQGFDASTANRLAAMQTKLGTQPNEEAPTATGPQTLEARDMRFSTGQREQQEQSQREAQAKAQVEHQKRLEEAQEKQRIVAASMLEQLKKIAAKKELELVTV